MAKEKYNPLSWFLNKLRPTPPVKEPPQITPELQFIMESNGFSLAPDGAWESDYHLKGKLRKGSEKFQYGIFGSYWKTLDGSRSESEIAKILGQLSVIDVIKKYRKLDEDEARRIAIMLGTVTKLPIPKDSAAFGLSLIAREVEFIARLANFGGEKSGEAVASAMALNLFSDMHFISDYHLEKNVYDMAETITEDDTNPQEVEDLGISQAFRLWRFVKKIQTRDSEDNVVIPSLDISQYREAFSEFPTVGAEFHIPEDEETYDNFWQRVTLLNMSQYQRETLIPFSRNDQGLIEIRMNPSIYPIAVANWKLMRWILPEINRQYFTITLNRKDENFSKKADHQTISLLQSLGSLCYAAHRKDIPIAETPAKEPELGSWYMGQSVMRKGGRYTLVGSVQGGNGQLNLYTGFGDSYPDLALYLSMALIDPMLHSKYGRKIMTLQEAIQMPDRDIQTIFEDMNDYIISNPKLKRATEYGQRITALLSP